MHTYATTGDTFEYHLSGTLILPRMHAGRIDSEDILVDLKFIANTTQIHMKGRWVYGSRTPVDGH